MIKLFNLNIDLKLIILPIVYIAVGIICYEILKKIITKVIASSSKRGLKRHQKQRMETITSLLINIIKYVIVILEIIGILGTFGVNVTSLVAGLGVTTAIIGLAFQDLAKDLIAGFSIITEAQYEVGDIIEVDGFKGEVVFLGLKTTRIQDLNGAVKIISNHNIDKLINYSLNLSKAVVEVGTSYSHKPEEVEEVLNKLADDLDGKIPEAKSKIKVLGIDDLADSSVVYKICVDVEAQKKLDVERYLRKEIKKAFDKNKINIPFPQVEVHNGK